MHRMATELTELPESFAAGTTVTYRRTFTDYPASDGWALTLYLAGASAVSVEAIPDGDDFVVTIAAAEIFEAGVYKFAERVLKDDEVYQVAAGVVTITPDLSSATPGSQQEWLERAIAALKAHIEGRLPAALQSYAIAGRQVAKMDIKEASGLLADYEARLARIADPTRVSRPVLIQFPSPGFDQ